jgi:serine/threonine protein kinase
MALIPTGESELRFLVGRSVPSSFDARVSYEFEAVLGQGATAAAFVASRIAPTGKARVVIKVLLPHLLRQRDDLLRLAFKKEVVALGRLGEHVPATPFVVRLIEAGELTVERLDLSLPWLALEFVHGGVEGTTLYERVVFSLEATGLAFPAERAARAIECIAAGLEAIHGVGVIHRDLNPGNVLCCGAGHEEVFKIADFGISRPVGLSATFGQMELGTPGYSAPEQMFADATPTTAASDIFSFGSVVFMLLTGEELFPGSDNMVIVRQALERQRRSIAQADALDPELRSRPATCHEIDRLLARATAPAAEQRFEQAGELAASLLPLLRVPRWTGARSSTGPVTWRSYPTGGVPLVGWSWQLLHRFGEDRMLVRTGWQSGGQCLALTHHGLEYWDGTEWQLAAAAGVDVTQVRCLRSVRPGAWLLGGEQGLVVYYSHRGPPLSLRGPAIPTWVDADGDPEDLAVFVGQVGSSESALYALCGGHWLKPLPLEPGVTIASLVRVSEERWLLVGRTPAGVGAVWLYDPLAWELWSAPVAPTRAYVACATSMTSGAGAAVGMSGAAVRVEEGSITPCPIPGEPDLSAVAMAPDGTTWAASLGRLWRFSQEHQDWHSVWEDPSLKTPMVALYADHSRIVALGVDGGVIEGRRSPVGDEPASSVTPVSLRQRR